MDNAFPIPGLQGDPDFNGLTKREYFAAMAMQGLLSSFKPIEVQGPDERAEYAVKHADALFAALAK